MGKEEISEEQKDKVEETVENTATEKSEDKETEEETVEVEALEEENLSVEEKLQIELAEQKDKFLRLYSEFENFRKRTAKEKIDLIATANEKLILGILPVVDDFERAEQSMAESTDVDSVKEGVQLIKDKLIKTLESKGLKPIDTEDKAFDTEEHEAITQIPAPTEEQKGKVVDCVEKGYYLGEKVIRYAKVVIGA